VGLTFVPTPLGNLGDITLRGLEALKNAAVIVAEDTRVARRLLSAYDLPGRELIAYHEHNAASTTATILARAREVDVCVVTDAGMPGISDPGTQLVAAARAAGVRVDVLPGAVAFVCAAVLSGFDLRRFSFEGFVPRGGGERRAALARAATAEIPSTWYESPQRIGSTLAALAAIAPTVRVFLVRELTKKFEQQIAGTPAEVLKALDDPVRGEIAFAIEGAAALADAAPPAADDIDAAIDALLERGATLSAIGRELAGRGLGERRALYARASARKSRGRGEPHPGD
jgi:16S rRNA (cytidine1402-2'-O)-methyltransferase